MPNIKSAKKRVLISKVRNERNRSYRSALRTAIKKADLAIEAKAAASVLNALGQPAAESEFKTVDRLHALTKTAVPEPIAALSGKTVRFKNCCKPEEMQQAVLKQLLKD